MRHGSTRAEKSFIFACHAQGWFAHGTLEDKRQMLMVVCSNLVLQDKKLNIEDTKPFAVLETGLKTIPIANAPFEPLEYGSVKPQKELVGAQNPDWWTTWESVGTKL